MNTNPKYEFGYEKAKEIIEGLSFDKIADYIELLNQGYVPKSRDKETKFSNGEQINQFWSSNKDSIIERLNTDPKYEFGYDLAKKIVEIVTLPQEEKKQRLLELKEYINNMNQDNMSSGGIKRW